MTSKTNRRSSGDLSRLSHPSRRPSWTGEGGPLRKRTKAQGSRVRCRDSRRLRSWVPQAWFIKASRLYLSHRKVCISVMVMMDFFLALDVFWSSGVSFRISIYRSLQSGNLGPIQNPVSQTSLRGGGGLSLSRVLGKCCAWCEFSKWRFLKRFVCANLLLQICEALISE